MGMSSRPEPQDEELLQKLDDAYFRHMFQAFPDYYERQLLQLEAELPDSPQAEPNAEQLARFEQRIAETKHWKKRAHPRLTKRTLIVAAVLIMLTAALLMTANAFRWRIFNFLKVPTAVSTEIGTIAGEERPYQFLYMPEQLSERLYTSDEKEIHAYFVDMEDETVYLDLYIYLNDKRFSVDTEDAAVTEEIQIGASNGFLTSKNNRTIITWALQDQATSFYLSSTLPQSELIKIARNISA